MDAKAIGILLAHPQAFGSGELKLKKTCQKCKAGGSIRVKLTTYLILLLNCCSVSNDCSVSNMMFVT